MTVWSQEKPGLPRIQQTKRAAENASRPPFGGMPRYIQLFKLLELPTLFGVLGRSTQKAARQIVRRAGNINPQQRVPQPQKRREHQQWDHARGHYHHDDAFDQIGHLLHNFIGHLLGAAGHRRDKTRGAVGSSQLNGAFLLFYSSGQGGRPAQSTRTG